jgi:hypothetical protein
VAAHARTRGRAPGVVGDQRVSHSLSSCGVIPMYLTRCNRRVSKMHDLYLAKMGSNSTQSKTGKWFEQVYDNVVMQWPKQVQVSPTTAVQAPLHLNETLSTHRCADRNRTRHLQEAHVSSNREPGRRVSFARTSPLRISAHIDHVPS